MIHLYFYMFCFDTRTHTAGASWKCLKCARHRHTLRAFTLNECLRSEYINRMWFLCIDQLSLTVSDTVCRGFSPHICFELDRGGQYRRA